MIAILRILVTFGPAVVQLIADTVRSIQKAGAGKDRKKAERIIFVDAWKRHNIAAPPPREK